MAFTQKTSILNKFIISLILTVLIVSPFANANAAVLGWENPDRPAVQMKLTDVLNAKVLTQVVGCTGVVDKVAFAFSGLLQKVVGKKLVKAKADAIRKTCAEIQSQIAAGVATIPEIGAGQATAISIKEFCKPGVDTTMGDSDLVLKFDEAMKESGTKFTNECLAGVAYVMAKNTLVSMTRQAVNWVNSGFNGNPFFVNLTRDTVDQMGRNIAEPLISEMIDPDNKYPFGYSFVNSYRNSYGSIDSTKNRAMYELRSLSSDLSDFISDPNSYYNETNENYKQTSTLNEKDKIYAFTNDFRLGGWDAWLALTQRDQNNPLGFTMRVSQLMEEEKQQEVEQTKNELYQNDGFLSQKVCEKYGYTKPDASSIEDLKQTLNKTTEPQKPFGCGDNEEPGEGIECITYRAKLKEWTENDGAVSKENTERICVKWKTVTPGSLIKDKISNYLSSPERALEVADSINEVLYSLFDGMIAKLQQQGLADLGNKKPNPFETKRNLSDSTIQRETFASGYSNGSFNLVSDLGNRFINSYRQKPLGNWDAQNNIPKLSPGVAPVELNDKGELQNLSNVYYVVTKAGKTKLIENGFNGWAVGDRAFWDGTSWQNWKKETATQTHKNPIANRGILQTQEDYVVAAREMLSILPGIMPKFGELDYCIPGPNPGWAENISESRSSFADFIYTLTYSTSKRGYYRFSIVTENDQRYLKYKNTFMGSNTAWSNVQKTYPWLSVQEIANAGTQKNDMYKTYMDDLFSDLEKSLINFTDNYNKKYSLKYGPNGLMQKRFLQKEDTSEQTINTAFLPSANDSYSLLKKMGYYNEEIKQKTLDYSENIKKAQSNKAKLQNIKDEVSKIIKRAQARRDARLLEVLNNESKRTGSGTILTKEQYETKYKDCLDQEEIAFYEDTEITDKTGAEKERCTDELDNDLDGLVDSEDKDCNPNAGNNKGGTSSGGGSNKPDESKTGDEREKYNPRDEADSTEMQDIRY